MNTMYIGEGPWDEDVAQVGQEDYHRKGRKECRAFVNQIKRVCGEPPPGTRLFIKSNPHDFGSYLSVECEYPEGDEEGLAYALKAEGAEGLDKWDEEARKELEE